MQPKNWPRLSETLTGRRDLDHCQACDISRDDADVVFARWMEHDENDTPEPIVVNLCDRCASRLIEPHPRLYHRMDPFEPMPGAVQICIGCRFQSGLRCTNPVAKINGGPGLQMTFPKPTVMHVHAAKRSASGWRALYHGPVSACAGREVAS